MRIHTELVEIRKALEKALTPAERYRNELWETNKKLHENAWKIDAAKVSVSTLPMDENIPPLNSINKTADISTSTTNLIHLTAYETNPNDDNNRCTISAIELNDQDQPVNSFEHMQSSFAANGCSNDHNVMQSKSIIDDNINLRIR